MEPNLFLFGVPGKVGGAATKIRHLIILLRDHYRITVVLPHIGFTKDREITSFLRLYDVPYCLQKDLPAHVEGIALAICREDFFVLKVPEDAKRRGMKVVWSNEMMWEFKGEREAAGAGLIDKVLFVSGFQAAGFQDIYRGIPFAIPGNYVAPEDFAFRERTNAVFTMGRLSRPDPGKYPEDFPVFYEEMGLDDVRFRVMAWNDKLRQKYRWHRFGERWELLGPQKEDTEKFLQSLDVFLYPLGHLVKESWGRSTVEAMLTGCVPVVPHGHQFHKLLVHGESGFICRDFDEYRSVVQELHDNYEFRSKIARQSAEHARTRLCNREEHRKIWIDALTL